MANRKARLSPSQEQALAKVAKRAAPDRAVAKALGDKAYELLGVLAAEHGCELVSANVTFFKTGELRYYATFKVLTHPTNALASIK